MVTNGTGSRYELEDLRINAFLVYDSLLTEDANQPDQFETSHFQRGVAS